MGKKPNILFIVADSARYDRLSCYGYHRKTTPFLDSFAREGSVFNNCISQGVWTLPVHASLFTGLYPGEHGLFKGTAEANIELPENYTTLAQMLKEKGYRTAGFSNNPWVGRLSGMDRGFDFFMESNMETKGDISIKLPLAIKMLNRLKFFSNNLKARNILHYMVRGSTFNNTTVEGMLKWLEEWDGREPFFLFVNFMDLHQPYYPPKEYLEKFQEDGGGIGDVKFNLSLREYYRGEKKLSKEELERLNNYYDASLNFLDSQIERVISYLEKRGVLDDTLVIFTSDHGKILGDYDINDSLSFIKDANIKVPLIIRYPEGFGKGNRAEKVNQLIDVFHVILKTAGAKNPEDRGYRKGTLEEITEENCALTEAVLPYTSEEHTEFVRCLCTWDYKLVDSRNSGKLVFDFREDPYERRALKEHPARDELESMLEEKIAVIKSGKGRGKKKVSDLDEEVKNRLKDLGYM